MKKKDMSNTEEIEMNINADSEIPGSYNLEEKSNEEAENELEKLRVELDEQKDKYLRQAAEFDNFRRRSAKEKIDLIQTAGKDMLTALLPVLDDIERAEKQMESSTDTGQILEGNKLVFNKLRSTLMQKGLKPMNCSGEEFDVEKHEAIAQIEAGPDSAGKVIDEVEKGYLLNDNIIRFAKVVVGK